MSGNKIGFKGARPDRSAPESFSLAPPHANGSVPITMPYERGFEGIPGGRNGFDGSGPTILTVPGLNGSGPSHWQTLWERARPDVVRAELGQWNLPHRNSWVTKLDQAIRQARAPVVLAAHSLGCVAVAWWAQLSPQPFGWPVAGALLVAPADADRPGAQDEITAFAPVPRVPLPFPSIVVASTDDPYASIQRSHSMAADWGSHFVDLGEQGHLNAASGLGSWPEGQALLERVVAAGTDWRGRPRPPGDARALLAVERSANRLGL